MSESEQSKEILSNPEIDQAIESLIALNLEGISKEDLESYAFDDEGQPLSFEEFLGGVYTYLIEQGYDDPDQIFLDCQITE